MTELQELISQLSKITEEIRKIKIVIALSHRGNRLNNPAYMQKTDRIIVLTRLLELSPNEVILTKELDDILQELTEV